MKSPSYTIKATINMTQQRTVRKQKLTSCLFPVTYSLL